MGQSDSSLAKGKTAVLAAFAASLELSELPEAVVQECRRALVNGVGCLLGGAQHDMVKIASDTLLRHEPQQGPCTLFGQGRSCSPFLAARLNGLAGAAYSFDDTYGEAMLHPGVPILAAIFALAPIAPVDGQTFLLAFATGMEIGCRLTKALTVAPAVAELAWSQTGIVAGVAGAVACAKLLGLNEQKIGAAVGIAAAEAGGTRAAHGSMAASMIFGNAAESGLRAAVLAADGFTAPPDALEHRSGLLHLFSRAADPAALTDALGERFELLDLTYKPYPCGIVIHPAIDVALALRKQHELKPDQITQVVVTGSEKAVALASRPSPANDLEAKVSLHHWVAAALAHGRAGLAEGHPSMVADPTISGLRHRITLLGDPMLPPVAARIVVTLADGSEVSGKVDACIGSRSKPMTDADLTEKCTQQAETVLGRERAEGLAALCWNLHGLADAAEVARFAA